MGLVLEPIVIAAIAAGGAAVLVLLVAGSILLHRRLHPLPSPASRRSISTSASRSRRTTNTTTGRPSHTPSSSGSRSSTRKSPMANPYLTPPVPRVQPPPQRRPGSKARPPAPSSNPPVFPYSPTYLPVDSPSTAPGQAGLGTKLRKLDYKTPLPPPNLPRASPTQRAPKPHPHPPSSNFDSVISPPEISRPMSANSSVMLITYEQGLAKLGLSNTPRPPLPTSNTMPTISSHPSYSTSVPSSHSSPLVKNPSPSSSSQSPYAQPLRTPSTASSGGDTKYRPQMISMTAVSTLTGPTSPVYRHRRDSLPRTITPDLSSRPGSLTYKEGRAEVWENEEVELPQGDRGAWLPSYYMPKVDKAAKSKSRWGGRV